MEAVQCGDAVSEGRNCVRKCEGAGWIGIPLGKPVIGGGGPEEEGEGTKGPAFYRPASLTCYSNSAMMSRSLAPPPQPRTHPTHTHTHNTTHTQCSTAFIFTSHAAWHSLCVCVCVCVCVYFTLGLSTGGMVVVVVRTGWQTRRSNVTTVRAGTQRHAKVSLPHWQRVGYSGSVRRTARGRCTLGKKVLAV